MSHRIDDRWLWLGVGIGLVVAFKGIKYAITDIVRLTQVKPLGKDQDEELQRQPEDCATISSSMIELWTDTPPSNSRRRPAHTGRLPKPQHQQMRYRHRLRPLCEKSQLPRRSPGRRIISKS